MKLDKYYVVTAVHPNLCFIVERKIFTTKKEALSYARSLAKETFYEIDVTSDKGRIGSANLYWLPRAGVLFTEPELIDP